MVFHCFHGFLSLYTANKVLPVLARLSPGRPSASAQHTDQALSVAAGALRPLRSIFVMTESQNIYKSPGKHF